MISGVNLKYLSLFFLVLALISCEKEKVKIDVSQISIDAKLERFEIAYYKSDSVSFKELKIKYPYFFPGEHVDSYWFYKKNDSLSQAIFQETQQVFGDFKEEHNNIENLFRYVKHYYSNFKEPRLITLISNFDLENQIIYADSLLLISVDTYLGKNKIYYNNYPEYLRNNFDKKSITNHIATAIAYEIAPNIPYRMFIERMIAAGKLKYAMHKFIPNKSEAVIMNYSQKQYDWAVANEESIWKFFIEKELLYSTDKDLKRRFLDPAPFSKFYLVSDNESSGQIGIWLGYQIVKAYMDNNSVSLPAMMATPPTDLFKKSKYKPRR